MWTGISVWSLQAYIKRFFMTLFVQTTLPNQKGPNDFICYLFALDANLNRIVNNYEHNQPYLNDLNQDIFSTCSR